MKFCDKCGAQITEGATFCSVCGAPVSQPQQQYQQQPQDPYGAPPSQQQYVPPEQQQYAPPPQQQYTPPPQQQYAPPPQQQYGAPPPQQQYSAKPPNKFLSIKFIILYIIIAVAVIVGIFVVPNLLNSVADKDFFELSGDRVPSVKYVLGDAPDVSKASTSKSGGVEQMVIEYKAADDPAADMEEYANALISDFKFFSVNGFDFSEPKGRDIQFAKESSEEGFVVLVSIDYTSSNYTITITRGEGTLNIQDNTPEEPPVVEDDPPQTEEPPPEEPPDSGNTGAAGDVQIIMPAWFTDSTSVEEEQAKLPADITVLSMNGDGSFVYSMSKSTQEAAVNTFVEAAFDKMDEAAANISSIEGVMYDPNEFSAIYFIASPQFNIEDGATWNAVLPVTIRFALAQVYMGKGNSFRVWTGWGPEDGQEDGAFFYPDDIVKN